jgi:hypothetical protein
MAPANVFFQDADNFFAICLHAASKRTDTGVSVSDEFDRIKFSVKNA